MVVADQIMQVNVPSIFIKHATNLSDMDHRLAYQITFWWALRDRFNNNMIAQQKLDERHWLKVDM